MVTSMYTNVYGTQHDGYGGYDDFDKPQSPPDFYNTDAGPKRTMQTQLYYTPHRYAVMQSRTERFPDNPHSATPFGVYNTDAGNKKHLSTSVRDSRRLLAASFSKTTRWPSSLSSSSPDVVYDTDLGRFQTIGSSVEGSPMRYSNVRSKYRRFKPLNTPTDGPDVMYDTDYGIKSSLTTSMSRSPILYSTIRSTAKRFQEKPLNSTPLELGPGSYDPPAMLDLRTSQELRPLSSFSSTSARFGAREDPSKFLGGTWKPETDKKKWEEKGTMFSKAAIRRPAYLPP